MSETMTKTDGTATRLPGPLAAAAQAAYGKKATEVTALDLRKVSSFTDYFLICTAQNARQVRAVAEAIEEALAQEDLKPAHTEGYERSGWVLLDYFDFVVHVFTADERRFYSLDRLWGSAERIDVPDTAAGPGPAPAR